MGESTYVETRGIAAMAAIMMGSAGIVALTCSMATAEPSPAEPPKAEAAAVPVSPLNSAIRQKLSQTSVSAPERDDMNALNAYYGGGGEPLWVTALGFTPRAEKAMAEIRQADDWELEAKAFALPSLADGEKPIAALADAEVKLGLAALKYARFAKGGRVDPTKLGKYMDMKPTLPEPKTVIAALAGVVTPMQCCAATIPSMSNSSCYAKRCSIRAVPRRRRRSRPKPIPGSCR